MTLPIFGDPCYPDKTIPESIKPGMIVYCVKEYIYKQERKESIMFKKNQQYKVTGKLITGIGVTCEPTCHLIDYYTNTTLYQIFVQIDFFNEYFMTIEKMRKVKLQKLSKQNIFEKLFK